MKLIRCYIENFGKLKNQEISFSDGCNVCCRENGWGKSTLAAFLKVMFYGFDHERSRDDYSSERRRYRPWQGGVYGGSLVFEQNGRQYRVTRTFGRKEKEDSFVLREETTNLISHDFSEKLGEELFGIDSQSFGKTIFLEQREDDLSVTDQIHAKIGNFTETLDDMRYYEQADARLNDRINALNPGRKTGMLYKQKEQIQQMEVKLAGKKNLEAALQGLMEKKEQTFKELEEGREEIRRWNQRRKKESEQKEAEAWKEKWNRFEQEYHLRRAQAQKARTVFPGRIPGWEELEEKLEQCVRLAACEKMREVCQLTEEEKKNLSLSFRIFSEEDEGRSSDADTQRFSKKEKKWKIPLFLGGIFFLCGFFCLMKTAFFGVLFLGIGVGLLLAAAMRRQNQKTAKEYEKFLKEQGRKESAKKEYERLLQKKTQYEEALREEEKRKKSMLEFFASLQIEPQKREEWQEQLLRLRSSLESYEHAEKEAKRAEREFAAFQEKEKRVQVERILAIQEDVPEKEEEELQIQMEEGQRKLAKTEQEIQDCLQQLQELGQLEEQRKLLLEEYEQGLLKFERLKKTKEYLAKAKAGYTAKYRNPLMESFSSYYKMLTGETADGYRLDANLCLTREELGDQREMKYLSQGWRNLTALCMRVALVDAMYQKELPFLIFDDPFVHLDQKKTEAGKAFLSKLSKKYQIIYFTCHESRK